MYNSVEDIKKQFPQYEANVFENYIVLECGPAAYFLMLNKNTRQLLK